MKIAILSVSAKRMHISRNELISYIINKKNKLLIIGPKDEIECHENLSPLGVEYIGINLSRTSMNPLYELRLIADLYKQLKKEKPDIIISYGIKMAIYGSLSAIFSKVDRIFPVINGRGTLFQMQGPKGSIVKSILYPAMKFAFNKCNLVFFQNPDDFKLFQEKRLICHKKGKIVNGSGVNLMRFSETEMPSKPVFLLVSRLIWSKGIKEYIEAALEVKQKHPEARFILLGPFDNAINAIKQSDIENYVKNGLIEYAGTTPDVYKYYKMCTCYVLPSFYGEGVPRTLLEAMATGRPIITTNSPGCKETVIDRKNGFLIPPKDATSLAEKMCWMIDNPEQARMMGRESRKYCERKFDVNAINKTMMDLMGI